MVLATSFLLFLSFSLSCNALTTSHGSPPTTPFLFPETKSTVLPNPAHIFSSHLLSSPLPTNSFFQNFVVAKGDDPEYIHPYLIKSASSSLSLSYPFRFSNSSFVRQIFVPDLTITSLNKTTRHRISSYSDLSVTLDFPSNNLRFYLVRGSPFLTCKTTTNSTRLSISTIHAILSFSSDASLTKHTVKLNYTQTWLLYTSSPIRFTHSITQITSQKFSGVIRIAILPNSEQKYERVLDKYSSCYPISGRAKLSKAFGLEYKWKTKGRGKLLLLAHPLHRRLLSRNAVLEGFEYKSIDGDLVGVIGDSWVMKLEPIPVTWHSIDGIRKEHFPEIVSALRKDVDALRSTKISTPSSYFYGKSVARAARLALIAEEVGYPKAIPAVAKFLKNAIQPWLDGNYDGNGFLYERKWGGLVTQLGSTNSSEDFGFGIYNDHHFHLGYFVYGIAVLAKIDPAWGRQYKPQAYSLMADYMNVGLGSFSYSYYPQARSFDPWKLHSWAAGLQNFSDGRNQESTSEAVNAYYSAALLGLAYKDNVLKRIGSTLAALEILSAQTWWHVREGDDMYGKEFSRKNRLVGILWANMRDSKLWFAPAELKACRLGIQVLPISPITEILFSDAEFAKDVVKWASPSLSLSGVAESWKDFVYALEGIYNYTSAIAKTRKLTVHDDGNSLANLLWWIYSQGR
ncbi:primary septum endo-1,3(4)-beta-glucanase-like [Fagus crenata]